MSKQKILLGLILCFLLSGCGFTLRPVTAIPPQLQHVYFSSDNPYGTFEVFFKKTLRASGVTFSDSQINSCALHLTSSFSYTTTSPATSVQARVYALTYSANIVILNSQNKLVFSAQNITVNRNISLAPNEIFEVSLQTENAKQEMQRELTTKIINILSSKNVAASLEKTP
ncbi:MAG: hypothetical protein M1561_00405 [Gammaproteobacteria bacterium]|nr:hypothetical protein [Gammaproteobacteria bacterium]